MYTKETIILNRDGTTKKGTSTIVIFHLLKRAGSITPPLVAHLKVEKDNVMWVWGNVKQFYILRSSIVVIDKS